MSSTGFDLEDALLINKGSIEKGFGQINIRIKNEIELEQQFQGKDQVRNEEQCQHLDSHGVVHLEE